MAFHSLAGFVLSSASISVLIGIAATAVAILEPKFLDAITDLRKWAIAVACVAFAYTAIAGKFYHDGLAEKQAEWDAALVREAAAGEKARNDAVAADPPASDRGVFSGDKWNRDAGNGPAKPASKVWWLAPNHLLRK
jgi:hypothetical protein